MTMQSVETLKLEGNSLFSKGKYGAAIERYTEAITLSPAMAVLYVNRAMAHRKKEQWERVAEDAAKALQLEKDHMKANYLAGLAGLHLQSGDTLNYDPAIRHLRKALGLAREANDSIKDDIWRELARAEYSKWQLESDRRRDRRKAMRKSLLEMQGLGPDDELPAEWEELFQDAGRRDQPEEVPSAFTCPITLETFRDPCLTKSGQTYERSVLMEHLKKNKWDPITRQPMTEADVFPDLALRQALMRYLEEHPWAWKESIHSAPIRNPSS